MIESEFEISDPIRVMILSDRLIDNAKKLSSYLISAGVQVVALVTTGAQALGYCNEKIDFLIIAGYLKDERSYGIVKECRNRKLSTIAVHWAILDELIFDYCKTYNIELMFERTLPIPDFVSFLQQHRPSSTALIDEEIQQIQHSCKPTAKHKEHLITKIKIFLLQYFY